MTTSTVPIGWSLARISELVGRDGAFIDGDWVESKDQDPDGDVRLIQLADVGDAFYVNKSARFLTSEKAKAIGCTFLQPEDVLVARMPAPLGRACLFPGDAKRAVTVVDVCIVRPSSEVDRRWLMWTINCPQFRRAVAALQSGSTRQRISRGNLATLSLPVPPYREQQRIVAEIEKHFTRLDAAVAVLKRVQVQLRRYRASVLKAAVEGRLVPTEAEMGRIEGRTSESGCVLAGRSSGEQGRSRGTQKIHPNLPPLPDGWGWTSLRALGELNRGRSRHRPRDEPRLYGGPYPFIQTGDVRHSEVFIRTHSQTYSEEGLAQSRLWPTGTLCITIAANIAETGILAYPACFPDSVVGFVCEGYPEVVRFVELFLRTAKERLERFAPATAQKNINIQTLSQVAVPIPPLPELRRVVAEVDRHLSVIGELEQMAQVSVRRAERMCAAILARAFTGHLVPQDPSDEPAAALLERIRAERQVAGTTAKPKGRKPRTPRPVPSVEFS